MVDLVSACARLLSLVAALAAVVLVAAGIPAGALTAAQVAGTVAVLAPAVVLGLLVIDRRPGNVVGAVLVALGTVPLVVSATEAWGATATGSVSAWPWARAVGIVSAGDWAWIYLPLVWLALLFPDGRLVSWRWRMVLAASVVFPLLVQAMAVVSPQTYAAGGGLVPGEPPFRLPVWAEAGVSVVAAGGLLAVLIAAASSVVVRARRGNEVVRRQIRWFALSAPLIPVALLACWVSYVLFGDVVPLGVAALGLVFVAFPCAVAVAVLRHDLYDIDRLISRTLAYTTLTVLLVGLFVVTALAGGLVLGQGSAPATGLAAVLCTLSFSPLRRRVQATVDRRFYGDREMAIGTVRRFVETVRDGRAEPEEVERILQQALADPALRVRYRLPADGAAAPLLGAEGQALPGPAEGGMPVTGSGQILAVVESGPASQGRRGLAREVLREARLPIELSRLQVQLRLALEATAASRARLVQTADNERQRLQRDLHDGAQQRLVAVGLDLRHVQHALGPQDPSRHALDRAVGQLQEAVRELRLIAQGVRPSALDDGLAAALRSLVRSSPVPVELDLEDLQLSGAVTTAAYYVAAEALTNALKHSGATAIIVSLRSGTGSMTLSVVDDGTGGATPGSGSGLTGIADRIATLDGTLRIHSPPGAGTTIEAVLPCES